MIGFVARGRLGCAGFAPHLVTLLARDGFVFRAAHALVVIEPGKETIVPESADAALVAVSPNGTIAWTTQRRRAVLRWRSTEGTINARHDGGLEAFSLAVTDSGAVACAGYAWSRAHEEHAHAEAVYAMGEPYDVGENRPEIPPEPAREPGLVALWSDLAAAPATKKFDKAVVRVALADDALAAWTEDGWASTSAWRAKWHDSAIAVPCAVVAAGGQVAAWTHYMGIYARDPVRGVRKLVALDATGVAAISLASGLVAHAPRDGTIRFFSLDTGTLVGATKVDASVHALAFGADGRRFSVVMDDDVVFGDVADVAGAVFELPPRPPPPREEPKPAPARVAVEKPQQQQPAKPAPEMRAEGLRLAMNDYTLRSVVDVFGDDALRALVVAARDRLSAKFPSATFTIDGTSIRVAGDVAEDDLDRVASSEPYVLGADVAFLPLTTRAERRWATIVWGGSMDRSRLVVHAHSARVGGAGCEVRVDAVDDAVVLVEQRGHHIYVDPIGGELRAFFDGEWLVKRRFYGPRALVIVPVSGREPSVLVMLETASQAPHFAKHATFWESEGAGEWGNVLLGRALATRRSCGIVVGEGKVPVPDFEHVIHEDDTRTVVSLIASPAEIEAYASRVKGAHAVAREGECPADVLRRATVTS